MPVQLNTYFLTYFLAFEESVSGKPVERRGRKATRLPLEIPSHASRAAELSL